jgi:hypothetical protein
MKDREIKIEEPLTHQVDLSNTLKRIYQIHLNTQSYWFSHRDGYVAWTDVPRCMCATGSKKCGDGEGADSEPLSDILRYINLAS